MNKLEKKKTIKNIRLSFGELLFIIFVTALLAIGGTIATTDMFQENALQTSSTSSLPPRLINGLSRSYELLNKVYIGELDEDKLIDSALAGFVSGAGDKYTSYLNDAEMKSLQETTDGSFEGVGIEIEKSGDYIRVVSPIDDSPAKKGGLMTNDIITAINKESVKGISLVDLSKKVRGPRGSTVTLTILRNGSEFDVTLTRDKIPVTTVKALLSTQNKEVGIIRVSSFAKTTYDEMVNAVTQLRTQGATRFVIDVRSNPGGLLDAVAKVVNMFVEHDKVMFQMEDKKHGKVQYRSSDKLGTFKVTEPVTVLINQGSASASEIFAAALQELNRAKIIGVTSFGKGTAQSIMELTETTGIKITYSKWLTPNGNWVHEKGVTPDETVELPQYANLAYINTQQLPQQHAQGDTVLNIQKVLQALGYHTALNGTYDTNMINDITRFQKDNQLQADGVLDANTAQKLNEKLRQMVIDNDTQLKRAVEWLK